ncbi:hypothetical protein F652_1113 [Enterobacteriaceae bacterium bta3-1]|nr:hypothetical protein F652_1113 [Enterobacteriaceae bacterium bta3-1]
MPLARLYEAGGKLINGLKSMMLDATIEQHQVSFGLGSNN